MFADRLRDARKAKRYSQTEVSRMLGVTQQAVGKWETGRSTPDPQTVARLAEILDTTADALRGRTCALQGPAGRVWQRLRHLHLTRAHMFLWA